VASNNETEETLYGGHEKTMTVSNAMLNRREYLAWWNMVNRCDNPHTKNYEYAGARGITYDPRWKNFGAFLVDMGRKPSPTHALERRDRKKDYTKENCYWFIGDEIKVYRVRIDGGDVALSKVLLAIGMQRMTYKARRRRGENLLEALLRPIRRNKNYESKAL
jgi:hypothetical protein